MIRSVINTIRKRFHGLGGGDAEGDAVGGVSPASKPGKNKETVKRSGSGAKRDRPGPGRHPQRRRRSRHRDSDKRPSPSPRKKRPGPALSSRKKSGPGSPRADSWEISQFRVPPAEGKTRFHDLELPTEIMRAIADIGFQYCTPIQAAILPPALKGADVSGRAQTGTGKSAAFIIALLNNLLRKPLTGSRRPGTPRVLILAPTRELALQIEKDAVALSKYIRCEVVSVFGGMDFEKQKGLLERGSVDIVVATPGRLLDFKRRGSVHLGDVEILVIDEADRMLDMGFIPDVRRIIRATPPKHRRQTMLFGATLTPEVTRLTSQWTRDPIIVEIEPEQVTVDTIDQQFYVVTKDEKFAVLYNLIHRKNLTRVIVFCNRRDRARQLTDRLRDYDINCALLSGEVEQKTRLKRLENFREGKIRVLVATDVAARGLHIEDISHVVNYNLPMEPEDYIHRIGRTGRVTALGTSVSFACEDDSFEIPLIEKFIGEKIRCWHPDDDWLVLPPRPKAHPSKRRSRPGRRVSRRGGAKRRPG